MSAKKLKFPDPPRYFYREVGLNEDIERHAKEEKKLRDEIARLEANITEGSNEIYLRTYKVLLRKLLDSKAYVTDKIGRK